MSLLKIITSFLKSAPSVLGLLLSLGGLVALELEDLLQLVEDLGDLGLGCSPDPLELVLRRRSHLDGGYNRLNAGKCSGIHLFGLFSFPQGLGSRPWIIRQSAASDFAD